MNGNSADEAAVGPSNLKDGFVHFATTTKGSRNGERTFAVYGVNLDDVRNSDIHNVKSVAPVA